MKTVMEVISTKNELDAKEALVVATNFITNTLRTLIFTPKTPTVGHASENDDKLNIISLNEVSFHDTCDDCWTIIYDRVYDITNFFDNHPGGFEIVMEYAGRDSTVAFDGHTGYALGLLKQYEIGILPPNERIYRFPGTLRPSSSLPE